MNSPKPLTPDVEVEIKTVLGSTLISYEEYVNLQIDDLLILDQLIDKPLPLLVDGSKKFQGVPGIYEKKRALKIQGESDEQQA